MKSGREHTLLQQATIRWREGLLVAALCAGGVAAWAQKPAGQSSSQSAGQSDNPFPGDAPQDQAPQKTAPAAGQVGSGQKPASENPFPGEDANAPVIPVAGANAAPPMRRDADPDGDPVRTPDGFARQSSDDGFSSSRSGLNQVSAEDLSEMKPAKPGKSREQAVKEDLDVGGFYLESKNWKAAQGRFSAAFALDPENPDVVWGLAESERHLRLFKDAADHYKLFLSYEPDGRRGKEARKALAEVEASAPSQ